MLQLLFVSLVSSFVFFLPFMFIYLFIAQMQLFGLLSYYSFIHLFIYLHAHLFI